MEGKTSQACCQARGITLVDSVDAALRGGATVIQLRLKATSGGEMTRIAKEILLLCRTAGVPLLINDRVDVALAVDADGAHVGQDDIPCSAARAMLGPHKILGVSCKTPALAQKAQREGADYVGAGACFGTSTKDTSVIGLEGLKSVVKVKRLPIEISIRQMFGVWGVCGLGVETSGAWVGLERLPWILFCWVEDLATSCLWNSFQKPPAPGPQTM